MDTRLFEQQLSKLYHYKKLPSELSQQVRKYYLYNIPYEFSITGSNYPIYSLSGSLIANSYSRIVIGDYGAFIEFNKSESNSSEFIIPVNQEYRITDPNYCNKVCYLWYTLNNKDNPKIYYQKRRVSYADYEVGKYYISVHEVKTMKKVLFTHTDLDGAGSELIVRLVYPDIEVHRVDYGFDQDLENRKAMALADLVIFTDISMSRDTAKLLESASKATGKQLLLLDHHESAQNNLGDLGYSWIHIDQEYSGALLAYNHFRSYLKCKLYKEDLDNYQRISELVSDYDLWHHKYPKSKLLQFLWSGSGSDYFVNRFLMNSSLEFTSEEHEIINKSLTEFDNSYELAKASMSIETDSFGNQWIFIKNIGLLASLVADKIMKENPSAAYCVIFSKQGKLSLRSLSHDVRSIAEALGGGGHRLASGCKIPDDKMIDIASSIYERKWVEYPF